MACQCGDWRVASGLWCGSLNRNIKHVACGVSESRSCGVRRRVECGVSGAGRVRRWRHWSPGWRVACQGGVAACVRQWRAVWRVASGVWRVTCSVTDRRCVVTRASRCPVSCGSGEWRVARWCVVRRAACGECRPCQCRVWRAACGCSVWPSAGVTVCFVVRGEWRLSQWCVDN